MVYLIPLLLIVLGLFQYSNDNSKGNNKLYWSICASLILIFGLRYRVGGDTVHYMQLFEQTPKLGDGFLVYASLYFKEPGILMLFSIVKKLFDSYYAFYVVQLVHAAFVNVVIFSFLKKYSSNKFLAVFLYFLLFAFYFNTEIVKESVAICFSLFAFEKLKEDKYLQFALFTLCALFFHVSALFLIVVPLLMKSNKRPEILMIIFLIISLFGSVLFSGMSSILGSHISDRIIYASEYQLGRWGKYWNFIKTAVISLYVYYLSTKNQTSDEHLTKILKIACAFGALTISQYAGFYRIINYFYPVLVVCIANIISKQSFYSLGRSIILYSMLFVFFLMPYLKDTSDKVPNTHYYCLWFPYYSIFDEQTDSNRELFVIRNFED